MVDPSTSSNAPSASEDAPRNVAARKAVWESLWKRLLHPPLGSDQTTPRASNTDESGANGALI